MIRTIDVDELGIEAVSLDGIVSPSPSGSAGSAAGLPVNAGSVAYRPGPQPDGSLLVDPEIHLPSPGMDVDVAWYYSSNSPYNGPFGYGRTINTNLTAQASGTPLVVTLVRGNGAVVSYVDDGGQFVASTPNLINTLEQDVPNSLWKETTPDGRVTAYPLDTTGMRTTISYAEDAAGNRHSFDYSLGLLQTLEDAVGRKVSFSYDSGLLESIEDWAGRRTTFAYDTASVVGKPLLTTVTGPSGCQTGYGYDDKALLTRITDPNGYDTTYAYDIVNRITQRTVATAGTTLYDYAPKQMIVTNPLGAVVTATLDSQRDLNVVVNADGVATTFTRNPVGQEISREDIYGGITTTLYDSAGVTTGQMDALGRITTVQRDAYNNVTTITRADGSVWEQVYGYAGSGFDTTGAKRRVQVEIDALGYRTSYSYNSYGQMVSVQNALGAFTTLVYDGFGNMVNTVDALGFVTTTQYDLAGNVVGTEDALGHRTTSSYDAQNRVLTASDGLGNTTIYGYDSVGNLLVEIDPLGHRTSYSYNVFDSQVTIQNALGYVRTTVYDAVNRAIAEIDPLGRITTTAYDAAGRVVDDENALGYGSSLRYDALGRPVASVDALGIITTLAYDAVGRNVSSEDAQGNLTTTVYDAVDRVIAQVDALGYRTTTVYDIAGRQIALVDALGNRTTTVYDAANRAVASVDALGYYTTTVYDVAGRATEQMNALGFVSTMVYDAAGRAVAAIDPLGYVSSMVYDAANRSIASIDALGYRTSTIYDAASRQTATVDALGNRSSTVYDAAGQTVATVNALGYIGTQVYDATGLPYESMDALGNVTTTEYDELDRIVAIVDALGYRTTTLYDELDRVVGTMDQLGYITTTVYDEESRPVATVDALGRYTTSVYDRLGRAVGQIDALGYRGTLVYDAVGRVVASIDQLGYATTTVYDKAGRTVATVNALGYRTSYGYDPAGRAVFVKDARGKISTTAYDPRGQLLASVDTLGLPTTYQYDAVGRLTDEQYTWAFISIPTPVTVLHLGRSYDAAGRLTAMIDQSGYRTSYAYDAVGQMIDRQDAMGRRTTSVYDALGRQTVERNALGYRTTLAYDALGRRTSVQDAVNNVTQNLYDARGLLLSMQQPWGAFTTNSYDSVGNLTERVDGRDYRTTMTYDALDRIDVSQAMDGALTSHSYDAVGREIGLWDDTILATTTYDAVGQVKLVAEQSAGNAAAWSVSYSYDGVGNRTLMSDGEGRRTTYTYLSTPYTNAIVDIQPPYEPVKTRVSWYELYKSTIRFLNNGTASTEYQVTGLNGWELARTHFGPGGSQGSYQTVYDAAGNRLQMGESNAGGPTTLTHFTYDQTNQLLSERRVDTPGYANTYTYDGTGNRLTQNSLGVRTTYQYGSGNRLLSEQTGADTTSYSYDQNGNLTLIDAAGQLTTQTWNTDNRLTRVDNPDGSVEEMSYGADGHRRRKKVTPLSGPASDTIFVYDGQNLMQKRDGSGLIVANYTWGPDRLITEAGENWAAGNIGDTVLLQRRATTPGDLANGATHYFGTDPSANIRLLIDPVGTVSGRMTYEAFGEQFTHLGGTVTPFGFGGSVGYYTDAQRRLHALWRDVDPTTGKWLSQDPIGFAGGDWNLTRYVGNNPVNRVDPNGLVVDDSSIGGFDNQTRLFYYTCKCGWIDKSHFPVVGTHAIYDRLTKHVGDLVARGRSKNTYSFYGWLRYSELTGTSSNYVYQIAFRPRKGANVSVQPVWKHLAAFMSYRIYYEHELFTDAYARKIGWVPGLKKTELTSFSYEDLPSNWFGALMYLKFGNNLPVALNYVLNKCGAVSQKNAKAVYKEMEKSCERGKSTLMGTVCHRTRHFKNRTPFPNNPLGQVRFFHSDQEVKGIPCAGTVCHGIPAVVPKEFATSRLLGPLPGNVSIAGVTSDYRKVPKGAYQLGPYVD